MSQNDGSAQPRFQGGPGQPFPAGSPQQYGQPPQGWQGPPQPGYYMAPVQPPKKKRTGLKVLGGIVAAIVVISALSQMGGADDEAAVGAAPSTTAATEAGAAQTKPAQTKPAETKPAETKAPQTKPAEKQAPANALGKPVRSGDAEYTVSNFKCGVTAKGLMGDPIEPQGQFCSVDVVVKNVGKKRLYISDEDLRLVDKDGMEYAPSSDTFFTEGVLSFEDVNPGNSVKGKVYFDVAKGVAPTTVTVRAGLFSKAEKIPLG